MLRTELEFFYCREKYNEFLININACCWDDIGGRKKRSIIIPVSCSPNQNIIWYKKKNKTFAICLLLVSFLQQVKHSIQKLNLVSYVIRLKDVSFTHTQRKSLNEFIKRKWKTMLKMPNRKKTRGKHRVN